MSNYDFKQDGFTICRSLFTASECAAFKAEIERLLQDQSAYSGVFVGLAANSALFRELAAAPRLLDLLETALGPNIEFLSDKVVFKSAAVDFGSPWHQDYPYWHGAHKVSVWLALDKATPDNGCLKLLPGSHLSSITHDGDAGDGNGFGHRLSDGIVDESLAVTVACDPGDAVLFHDLTLHASFPNTSGTARWALISTYRNAAEPDLEYDWAVAAQVVRGTKSA